MAKWCQMEPKGARMETKRCPNGAERPTVDISIKSSGDPLPLSPVFMKKEVSGRGPPRSQTTGGLGGEPLLGCLLGVPGCLEVHFGHIFGPKLTLGALLGVIFGPLWCPNGRKPDVSTSRQAKKCRALRLLRFVAVFFLVSPPYHKQNGI